MRTGNVVKLEHRKIKKEKKSSGTVSKELENAIKHLIETMRGNNPARKNGKQ